MAILEPAEVIQFVFDELQHGTEQSVASCASLVHGHSYTVAEAYETEWHKALDLAFVERADELLKLVVGLFNGRDSKATYGYTMLFYVTGAIQGQKAVKKPSRGSPGPDIRRIYITWRSADKEKERLQWVMEKNPKLASTTKQLFLDSSAFGIKHQLLPLARAFNPNDEEIELPLQSELFNSSTPVGTRNALYHSIVGNMSNGLRFLGESKNQLLRTPNTVRFLKKLLDNQLGPEQERIVVLNSIKTNNRAVNGLAGVGRYGNSNGMLRGIPSRRANSIKGRVATVFHILITARTMLSQLDEGETEEAKPIREIIEQIVEVVDSDDPKDEWKEFRSLKIFKEAKQLLGNSEADRSRTFGPNNPIKDNEAVEK